MITFVFEELLYSGLGFVLTAAWRALPLIGIVLVVDLLMRRRIAARFHCFLWAIVIVRMLCPLSVTSSLSMHGQMDRMLESLFVEEQTTPAPELGFEIFTYRNDEGESVTVPLLPDDATDEQRAEAEAYVASLTPITINPATNNALNVIANESESRFDWETLLAYAMLGTWFSIACGILIRGTAQHFRFALRLRRYPLMTDQSIVDQVLRACDAVRVRRRPRLKEVDGLAVPAVFGLWRPVVCLPPDAVSELSQREFQWVLRHELAHIKRRDPLLMSAAWFMRACHWFNPLAWLVVSRVRNYMEQAADEIAMRGTPDHAMVDYGRLLLRYADGCLDSPQPATMGLLFVSAGKSLSQRIEMLDQNRRRNHWFAKVVAILGILVFAITGLTDAQTIETEPPVPPHRRELKVSLASWPRPGSQESGVRSRPSVAAKISQFQAHRFYRRCRQDIQSRVLESPKVTLFNGQIAVIESLVQRPFVTGVRPHARHSGVMGPIIDVISEGWQMHLHAEATEDEGVDIRCILTESEIKGVDLANLPFSSKDDPTAKVTVQVPSVDRTSVRSSVRLARDESLLIASPTIYQSEETDHLPTATFYMITPRLIPDSSFAEDNTSVETPGIK